MKSFDFTTARSGAGIIYVVACLILTPTPNARGQLSLASQTKARELLAQMTLDEKIGQMVQVDMNGLKDKAHIQKYALGSMLSGGDSDPADITAKGWRDACSEYQKMALTTRLKIPLLVRDRRCTRT